VRNSSELVLVKLGFALDRIQAVPHDSILAGDSVFLFTFDARWIRVAATKSRLAIARALGDSWL
jgi:hypothetical protein